MNVLEIRNLSVEFNQDGLATTAVRDVSFSIGAGETVAVVGESGSGKSVTALATVDLLPESALVRGSVQYQGEELLGAPETTLQRIRGNDISFIFQEPMTSLNPLHTIEKQLGESLGVHQGLRGIPLQDRIVELLTKVGIPDPVMRLANLKDESAKISTLTAASFDFGDYDKDLDIDFLISGFSASNGILSTLYKNET